jgi:hypothetical protein
LGQPTEQRTTGNCQVCCSRATPKYSEPLRGGDLKRNALDFSANCAEINIRSVSLKSGTGRVKSSQSHRQERLLAHTLRFPRKDVDVSAKRYRTYVRTVTDMALVANIA